MRLFLALLAVIGLLASPAVAAAAQATCHSHGGDAMMQMAMAEMPGMAQADGHKADPCCDPAKDQSQSKHHGMSCLQACAAMCGVVAALPAAPIALVRAPVDDPPTPGHVASPRPHDPSRLERPPRSIA